MRKLVRVLLLLSPLVILGFAFYEQGVWHPPLNPNITQPVGIDVLLEHKEIYKAPMKLIIIGDVYNKSESGDMLFLYSDNGDYFRVNCTSLDISQIEGGMRLYIMGYSYYHDPTKEYFLAEKIQIHTSYSIFLSIPGAILILIILFVGFKFSIKDFSFSRKLKEEGKDA